MPKIAKQITGVLGISLFGVALGAFGGTKLPKQPVTHVPIKQPVQSRRSAFGRVKVGILYSLFEAKGATSVDVGALLNGRSEGFVQYYLNDDKVDVDGATGGVWCPGDTRKYAYGGPPGDRTFIHHRLGLDTETAYPQVTALLPAWDSAHRGDGVTSLALICKQSKKEFQQEDFPSGLPQPSAVIDAQLVYDPRDEGQIQGDKSTYVWSDNPVLCLLAFLTDADGGMGLDYARHIFPAIASWISAAEDCDTLEVTESGTEKRYRCGGAYEHDNAPGDVISALISTFDGFLSQRGDGAFVVKSGRYEAPTVTLTDRSVLRYSVTHYLPDEQATNQYAVSFIDPETGFKKGDAGVVQDDDDIAARGVIRSTELDLDWVQSAPQAIRLAKRKLDRATQSARGTVTANLMGLAVLGERYVRLQISDNPSLTDLVVEVTGAPRLDLNDLTVSFPWIAADAAIDDGDPGGDVPIPPAPDPRPTPDPLQAPTIDLLTPVYDDAGAGVAGARIQIDITAPITADVQWLARWKLASGSDWHEAGYSDIDDGVAVTLITGFVPAVGAVDVQVRYLTAAQSSPWSATETIPLAAPVAAQPITTSQALAAGDLVNVWNSSGAKVRKADATAAGKAAHGFVLAAVANGAVAAVHFDGILSGLSGLTPGLIFYLDTTPGLITATAPATEGSGAVVQEIGVAISASEIAFAPKSTFVL